MKFTGLPVGTTITVTEAAKANYKGSTVVTLNGVETSKAAQNTMKQLQPVVNSARKRTLLT